MTETIRSEDVPPDVQPVCGKCKNPARWNGAKWEHAEAADAVFCQALFGRTSA